MKSELEELLGALSGKGIKGSGGKTDKSGKGASTASRTGPKKGQRLKGEARREAWQNVRELRKEYVFIKGKYPDLTDTQISQTGGRRRSLCPLESSGTYRV